MGEVSTDIVTTDKRRLRRKRLRGKEVESARFEVKTGYEDTKIPLMLYKLVGMNSAMEFATRVTEMM